MRVLLVLLIELLPIGIGRVRMKTPERAQQPPISLPGDISGGERSHSSWEVLPRKDFGLSSYPTVVMVIRHHQNDSTKVQT